MKVTWEVKRVIPRTEEGFHLSPWGILVVERHTGFKFQNLTGQNWSDVDSKVQGFQMISSVKSENVCCVTKQISSFRSKRHFDFDSNWLVRISVQLLGPRRDFLGNWTTKIGWDRDRKMGTMWKHKTPVIFSPTWRHKMILKGQVAQKNNLASTA